MKAIISHDIDHIKVWEHWSDAIIPKFLARSTIELCLRKIDFSEYLFRMGELFTNKWQNINELINFNKQNGVPNSFFIAVENGIGLNYSISNAKHWIDELLKSNCELGLHGIAFDRMEEMKKEKELFAKLSGLKSFGMRMHYVRKSPNTFNFLNNLNYTYDSTEHSFSNPYKKNNIWEFPIQLMDGWLIENGKPWQSENLEAVKENTKLLLNKAFSLNLNYIGIDFHDRYFSNGYKTWMDWYVWIVEHLTKNGIQLINFETAIKELERSRSTNETIHTHAVLSS